ncbi:MAG: type II toxin-antitoxin system VapC family toxin [Planctomycetes bacterium]|nr:type II toxin-antitoxin system VapC family toxin [Planctomycetota bacterium]
MGRLVYVETTIFSFYHDERPAPAIVAMRQWTREWWDGYTHRHDLVTSSAVLGELETGELPHRERALEMAKRLPAMTVDAEVAEIAEIYIKRKVMPADPLGDPLHLAFASVRKADYLLTWNCRHLANANKFDHIRRVNTLLGLHVPILLTPLELMGEEEML